MSLIKGTPCGIGYNRYSKNLNGCAIDYIFYTHMYRFIKQQKKEKQQHFFLNTHKKNPKQ